MKNLNPTLWRTCRMLAGSTRIRLLRRLNDHPGRCVNALAEDVGIGISDASQELRRIQSRGLLRSKREGARVMYRLEADPQVASAAPILKALKSALAALPPERDDDMCRIAFGLAYPRRIAIARALLAEPQLGRQLSQTLGLSTFAVSNHVRILRDSGWIRRGADKRLNLAPPDHPLAAALLRCLRTAAD